MPCKNALNGKVHFEDNGHN